MLATEPDEMSADIRTRILKPTRNRLSAKDLEKCVEALQAGGVIIFPTDTVYGMACNAFDPRGIDKIYELKGRSYDKPLPVFLSNAEQLTLVARDIPKEAKPLVEKYWPGPLTLVFKTAPMALHAVRGKSTIAVRIPDHGVVRQILLEAQVPLAVTSANKSGKPSIGNGREAAAQFSGSVAVIVDGGACRIGRESTVVEASQFPFSVIRAGALSKEVLARTLGL
jgi:L-threonylcarbamoyladenylate synthase